MITEKHFALSHAAFWRQLLPMAESYIRYRNMGLGRFAPPMSGVAAPRQRGLVNETGFRLFAAAARVGVTAEQLSEESRRDCLAAAHLHVSRMRQYGRRKLAALEDDSVQDALELAQRLEAFFASAAAGAVRVEPVFDGCGWVESCAGDVIADRTLFEVKAGDRRFLGADIRQVLCYAALNFASKQNDISSVCLVNPRTGQFFDETLDGLCRELSGRPAVHVLAEIVDYVSEPIGRYHTG